MAVRDTKLHLHLSVYLAKVHVSGRFLATTLVHHKSAPIWHFHTGLFKLIQNIVMNICGLEKRTDLKN